MVTNVIQFRPDEIKSEPESAMAHGDVAVGLSLSSFDVPRKMSIARDEKADVVRITFDYGDNEVDDAKPVGAITFFLGKNSGKILRMEARPALSSPKDTVSMLENGIGLLLDEKTVRDNQRMNYKLIRRITSDSLTTALEDMK